MVETNERLFVVVLDLGLLSNHSTTEFYPQSHDLDGIECFSTLRKEMGFLQECGVFAKLRVSCE